MLFPGVQLLVISARSPATPYVESQLNAAGYSNVYAALQQGVPESKIFVQDMGADGLLGSEGGTADVVYMRGREQRILNGDHKAAGMSESAYAELVRDTDSHYSALLTLLLQAVKAAPVAAQPR